MVNSKEKRLSEPVLMTKKQKQAKQDPILITPPPASTQQTPTSKEKYQRRKVTHKWPPVGTVIIGKLKGQVFKAQVIEGKNDEGKALKSLDSPKLEVALTFNDAAQRFTKMHRDKHGMKAIANPWKWYRRESDNKRLFDIAEYSKIQPLKT